MASSNTRPHDRVTAGSVAVGDLAFDVLQSGPAGGDVVILLHGFPQTATAWTGVLPALAAAGFHGIAITQRGYSSRARPTTRAAYHLDHLVDDVLGVADHHGGRPFHVVGHDWGGVVAWALAGRHPQRLRSMTSLATPHPAALARSMIGAQALRSIYALWFQAPVLPELALGARDNHLLSIALRRSGLSPGRVEELVASLDTETIHAALQWYRATPPWELATIPNSAVPTLYVWGTGDTALGPRAAGRTGDFVDAPYRFEALDASHWLPEDHHAEINPLLLRHLDQHSS